MSVRVRGFHLGRRLEQLRRYRHIMTVLAKYGFEEAAETLRSRLRFRFRAKAAEVKPLAKGRSRAARARMALEELGPTFIKLGQLLSTRPDLIPANYIEELERLQDQVPADKFSRVRTDLEKELGGKIEEIFTRFEAEPIAAGSIAQVHRATTKDGKEVVVKVRRPGIVKKIEAECRILEDLAGLLKTALFTDEAIDPQKMVHEFGEAVSKEVSLSNERQNQLRFLQSFADDPTVHIPQVYEEYCTDGVLTMEYIEGIRPVQVEAVDKAGLDRKVIAKRGADFVFRQVFELGFFHTDPHPGNFFLLEGNVLAPIDFGQVARLSSQDRGLLNEMLVAIVDNDAKHIVEAFERAEMVSEKTNIDELLRDAEELMSTYQNMPLREIPFSRVITHVFDLIREHQTKVPPEFTLMLKSLVTIESFALSLDPDFQIVERLRPYARQFRLREIDPKQVLRNVRKAVRGAGEVASRLPEDVNAILSKFRRGRMQVRLQHEHLDDLVKTLDKSSDRISFALIIAALLVGSSLLVSQEGMVLGILSLQTLGIIGFVVAAILGIWLLISIVRGPHV